MTTANDPAEAVRALGFRASVEAAHSRTPPMSPAQTFLELAALEKRERDARNLAARTKAATIGAVKPLDRFDWTQPACSIERELFEELQRRAGFIERARTCCCAARPGSARAPSRSTSASRRSPRATRFSLHDARRRARGSAPPRVIPAIERRLRRYTSCDLLIINELGYVPCDSTPLTSSFASNTLVVARARGPSAPARRVQGSCCWLNYQ